MSRQAQDTHQHDEENATSTAEADVAIELVNEVPPPPPLPLTDVAEIIMKTPRQTNSISKHKIQIAIGVVVLSIIDPSVFPIAKGQQLQAAMRMQFHLWMHHPMMPLFS